MLLIFPGFWTKTCFALPGCLSNGTTPCELSHLLGLERHPRQIHLTREYYFLRPVTDCESRPTLLLEH
jgi:hypothetical protein